jgi:hypothetical protein
MIGAIGVSYSAEYAVKGLYESSVGRLTEWLARDAPETEEDRFMRRVATEYARFIHATPWYEFPFAQKLTPLWALPATPGASVVRRWERRLAFTAELVVKSAWGWLMRTATQSAYDPEEQVIQARTRPLPLALRADPGIRVLGDDEHATLLSLRRYEPFTDTVTVLARQGVEFLDIAGNHTILMTVIARRDWHGVGGEARLVAEWGILTRRAEKRVAIALPVGLLHETIPHLETEGVRIDHLYDY